MSAESSTSAPSTAERTGTQAPVRRAAARRLRSGVAPTSGLRGRGGQQTPRGIRILLWVLLAIGALIMIIPFAWLLRSALMTDEQIFVAPPEWWPNPFAWKNFSESMTEQPFALYLLNTVIIEVIVVIGTTLSCAIVAFSFARLRWRGRNVVFAILLTSVMLPYAVTLIPTFVMWSELEALNTIAPLTVPAWFAGAGGGVFNIFLMRQFFLTIPFELDEAAYIDGATPWKVFWTVIMPNSKPVIVVVVIFTFIGVWNDFLGPLLYLTDNDKFTIALGLASFQSNYTAQWGYLMAASTLVILPIIGLFFLLQRYFVEGVTLTGIKS